MVLAVAMTLLAGCATYSPRQGAQDIASPKFTVGDSWTFENYQADAGGVNRTWVETVTGLLANGAIIRRVDHVTGKAEDEAPTTEKVFVDSGMLNFPLYTGKRWNSAVVEDDREVGMSSNLVEGQEEISTAAGTFATVRILSEFTRGGKTYRQRIWYAPQAHMWARLAYLDSPQRTDLVTFSLKDPN